MILQLTIYYFKYNACIHIKRVLVRSQLSYIVVISHLIHPSIQHISKASAGGSCPTIISSKLIYTLIFIIYIQFVIKVILFHIIYLITYVFSTLFHFILIETFRFKVMSIFLFECLKHPIITVLIPIIIFYIICISNKPCLLELIIDLILLYANSSSYFIQY